MTNDSNNRDAAVGRLLAETMPRAPAEEPGNACLDADTLAAWADDALDATGLALVHAHAADCARCRAMLAAMVKTAPAAPAASASWWRMPSRRWLVPLAAAAAAVLVWTAVPRIDMRQANVRQVSQSAESISPPEAPAAKNDALARDTSAPSAAPADRAEPEARRDKDTPAKEKQLDAASKVAPAPSANALTDVAASSADARLEKAQAGAAARSALAETVAPAAPAPLERTARPFSPGAPENLIVSSNPASRWRIVPGGAVQRSADGGSTWQTQNTGVAETLSAGSSPSPSVCWLVGPDGIVLLTTDGTTWKRLAVPEKALLTAIRATDAQTATVTTADGREFVTEDGGRTWTRTP